MMEPMILPTILPVSFVRPRAFGRIAVVTAAIGLLAASPASASFHFAHIERLMTGLGGTTNVQFVEIVMDASGQQFVAGTDLVAFNANGTFSHVVLTIPGNVAGGSGRPWVAASAAFQAASGIAPDFVFDSTGDKKLPPEDGMVCFGQAASPASSTVPNNMVDCVSYGNYTGPANTHTSEPSPVTPFGHGLVRIADSDNSAEDFVCENPAVPHNNAPQAGAIPATTPCGGGGGECGDGTVDEGEDCDDGDTTFASGEHCAADCTAAACGIPTKADGVTPKTGDALFVLRTSVSLSTCDLRVCDVNDSGSVTTGDALLVLRKAVGLPVTLTCPLTLG